MDVQVLGAHNRESQDSKFVSLLIDDILAIDAGGLTSSLSFEAQLKLKAILLTHYHYDHVRDIPALAMNFFLSDARLTIYSSSAVVEALVAFLLNDRLYPNFLARPPTKPTLSFIPVEPGKTVTLEGYNILAVSVNHPVPAVGYQVTSAEGKSVFYTSDTGPGLADCWQSISPQLLITEVTGPDRFEESFRQLGHLTPSFLRQELISFRDIRGYLPQVVVVHMNPDLEGEIGMEIAAVAQDLSCSIRLAYEGMQVRL